MNFKSFIEELRKAKHSEQIKELLAAITKSYDFQNFAYLSVSANTDKTILAPSIILNDYPNDWVDLYVRKNFHYIDPIFTQIHNHDKARIWNEFVKIDLLTDQQLSLLELAKQYNINNGITHPIHSDDKQQTALTFLFKPHNNLEQINQIRNHIPLIATALHQKLSEINAKLLMLKVSDENLSDRELECMIWSARGKTAWEISFILGVSENTIRKHLKSILQKLNAATKTEAITKAIFLGYITLQDYLNYN